MEKKNIKCDLCHWDKKQPNMQRLAIKPHAMQKITLPTKLCDKYKYISLSYLLYFVFLPWRWIYCAIFN
ncbi:MAG TPA: hypothetical protein DCF88_15070 [Plesiomonas shigelloides]|nr:Uncharacterised protein [Plesiomonas shigelloides]HAD41408.1 hypothetical protein [Plesiomonas shigelloides]